MKVHDIRLRHALATPDNCLLVPVSQYVSYIQVPSYYVISPKRLFTWEFMQRLNSNVMSPPTVHYIVYTIIQKSSGWLHWPRQRRERPAT